MSLLIYIPHNPYYCWGCSPCLLRCCFVFVRQIFFFAGFSGHPFQFLNLGSLVISSKRVRCLDDPWWSMMIPRFYFPKCLRIPWKSPWKSMTSWGSQISQRPYRNAFCLNLIIATTLKRLSAVAFVIIGIVKVFFLVKSWHRCSI